MKTDGEVRIMIRERAKGKTQEQAAARAGMSVRTARTYERLGTLPSQLKHPRTYRTRPDPFAEDWPWIAAELTRDPALQGTTLFALACERRPDHYRATQVRTLQRQIAAWRAQSGPDQEVFFAQVHEPGIVAQSDFTHMTDLGITLAGLPFAHLLFHLVLPDSNVQAVHVVLSESFEALAEGVEIALWQLGGVPLRHRTDHLSAAMRPLDAEGRRQATARYTALMAHYGMEPTTNNVGEAHENGDVEQAHFRFKQAVDQALRVRGSREFTNRDGYCHFLQDLVRRRNLTRQHRFGEERQAMRPLPRAPLDLYRELRVPVSRGSTIQVLRNTYSLPSRLIGTTVTVRVRAETLEIYRGTVPLETIPRLLGEHQHRIDYRHISGSLVRKPGAFAQYRFRDDLFPTLTFRRAYDAFVQAVPHRADREYVRLLHLATGTSEVVVDMILADMLTHRQTPTFDRVRDQVRAPETLSLPFLGPAVLDFGIYDDLLRGEVRHA